MGWTSLLVGVCDQRGDGPPEVPPFETLPTPDHAIVVALRGELALESVQDGRWRRYVKQPGAVGLVPAGGTERLRWHRRGAAPFHPVPFRSVHLYLPGATLEEAREHLRRAGSPPPADIGQGIDVHDPVVAHVAASLAHAVAAGAPDLYAEHAAQYLATHLLWRRSTWSGRARGEGAGNPAASDGPPETLTDRRLVRALDCMRACYDEPLSLARLAAEAGVSKFHFVRLFRAATGETPHGHLVRLRMRAARRLLRDTDLSVADVAAACGYASAPHFARVFARHAGCPPTEWRAKARVAGDREPPA